MEMATVHDFIAQAAKDTAKVAENVQKADGYFEKLLKTTKEVAQTVSKITMSLNVPFTGGLARQLNMISDVYANGSEGLGKLKHSADSYRSAQVEAERKRLVASVGLKEQADLAANAYKTQHALSLKINELAHSEVLLK